MSRMKEFGFTIGEMVYEFGYEDFDEIVAELERRYPTITEQGDEWVREQIQAVWDHPEIWDPKVIPFPEIYPDDDDVQD